MLKPETAPIGVMSYAELDTLDDMVLKNPMTIEQIATALSRICRYGGRGTHFYSVAQHCVLVSLMVSPENAMQALLHDAAEVYIGDIVGPFKRELKPLVSYKEHRIEKLVGEMLGVELPMCDEVDKADKAICKYEMDALKTGGLLRAGGFSAGFWTMYQSANRFLERYMEIKKW